MSHWYKKDGTPRYDATLREARIEHLVPGVTDVLKIIAQPGLEKWKQTQLLEAALTLPRIDGEPTDAYIRRIWADSKEYTEAAADLGTVAHAAIERYLQDGYRVSVPASMQQSISLAIEWIDDTLDVPTGQSEFVCVGHGYAGRVDWLGCDKEGRYGIVDFKTQNVKSRPNVYRSWHYQLAGYRDTSECAHATWAGNLIISTNPDNQGIWWRPVEDWYKAGDGFDAALKLWRVENNYYPGEDYD